MLFSENDANFAFICNKELDEFEVTLQGESILYNSTGEIDGHHCTYKKQWNEDKVNDAVAEIIGKLVNNPKFENEIRTKIGNSLDTKELEREQTNLKE